MNASFNQPQALLPVLSRMGPSGYWDEDCPFELDGDDCTPGHLWDDRWTVLRWFGSMRLVCTAWRDILDSDEAVTAIWRRLVFPANTDATCICLLNAAYLRAKPRVASLVAFVTCEVQFNNTERLIQLFAPSVTRLCVINFCWTCDNKNHLNDLPVIKLPPVDSAGNPVMETRDIDFKFPLLRQLIFENQFHIKQLQGLAHFFMVRAPALRTIAINDEWVFAGGFDLDHLLAKIGIPNPSLLQLQAALNRNARHVFDMTAHDDLDGDIVEPKGVTEAATVSMETNESLYAAWCTRHDAPIFNFMDRRHLALLDEPDALPEFFKQVTDHYTGYTARQIIDLAKSGLPLPFGGGNWNYDNGYAGMHQQHPASIQQGDDGSDSSEFEETESDDGQASDEEMAHIGSEEDDDDDK